MHNTSGMRTAKQYERNHLRRNLRAEDIRWFDETARIGGFSDEGLFRRMRLAFEAFQREQKPIPGDVLPASDESAAA